MHYCFSSQLKTSLWQSKAPGEPLHCLRAVLFCSRLTFALEASAVFLGSFGFFCSFGILFPAVLAPVPAAINCWARSSIVLDDLSGVGFVSAVLYSDGSD